MLMINSIKKIKCFLNTEIFASYVDKNMDLIAKAIEIRDVQTGKPFIYCCFKRNATWCKLNKSVTYIYSEHEKQHHISSNCTLFPNLCYF